MFFSYQWIREQQMEALLYLRANEIREACNNLMEEYGYRSEIMFTRGYQSGLNMMISAVKLWLFMKNGMWKKIRGEKNVFY